MLGTMTRLNSTRNLLKAVFFAVLAFMISLVLLFFIVAEAHAAIQATPLPFPTYGPVPTSIATPVLPTPAPPTSTPMPQQTAQPTPPPQQNPLRADLMGIQIHPNLREEQWRQMVDFSQFMGMKWIKVQLSWKELEPQPGQYTQLDSILPRFFQHAQGRNGFRLLVSIAKAPDWTRPAGFVNDGPPSDPKVFANYVSDVITRYGLRDVDAIEIWNEPNIAADWSNAALNGATYMKYFDAAYKAIRAKSNLTIITAGLAPTSDTAGSADDRRFLQEMYNAGLKNYQNIAVGIHPYGWANAPDARCCEKSDLGWRDNQKFFFLENIDAYRQIMVKNGHADVKLWGTEFGWSTFDNLRVKDHANGPLAKAPSNPDLGWMRQLNESQRTAYTLRAFELAQNGNYSSFMGPMFLWNLNFADLPGFVRDDNDSRPEAGFSILNGDGFPRPLYDALQAAPKK